MVRWCGNLTRSAWARVPTICAHQRKTHVQATSTHDVTCRSFVAFTCEGLSWVLLADDAGVDGLVRGARRERQVVLPVHVLCVRAYR